MRTDYKIGIVAVVLLGVVITTWTALNSGPDVETEADQHAAVPLDANQENNAAGDPGARADTNFFRRRNDDRVTEGRNGGIIGGRDAAGGGADGPLTDSAHEADLAAARRAAELARMRYGTGDSTGGSGWGALVDRTTLTDRTRDAGRAGDPRAATTTYTVKEGDQGFWAVAKQVYGDGKHWALIAQANPKAISSELQAGQFLKIPPLPQTADRTGGRSRAAERRLSGRLVTGADGKRYYYVQKGDAGFWAVALKAYGNGKHWALIAKANPNAVSADLKEGQKLLVPPRPVAPTTRGAATGFARTLKPGEKWYTVVEGDAGFWDVAKKSYGAGKHWEVIARANPNVDSEKLRKGQKILVPPLPPATRRTTPSTARHITYGDVPVFD